MRIKATKTFRGVEGLVRRGDVLEVSDGRARDLIRRMNAEPYSDKMAAAPVNKARPDRHPRGMTADNIGGLVTFGEGLEGNADGAPTAPNGSPTGEAGSPSSSQAVQAPLPPIMISSEGRRLRGRRPSSP